MTGREVYEIWAKEGAKWTVWVRPVPFIAIDDNAEIMEFYDLNIPDIFYLKEIPTKTAIIVDEEGYESIKEGMALALLGFRPIPLFNGTNEPINSLGAVNNRIVEVALIWGALILKNINLKDDANPVFLIDTNRMHRYKMDESIFDNSYDMYHQDFPSEKYFLDNGIENIIIVSKKIEEDLNRIFYKFKNIKILHTNGYEAPKVVKLKKPKGKE